MSQVVQAKCPHCKNTLHIPEAWLQKAMRCKHCKKDFQTRAKSSANANVPIGLPAIKAGAPPTSAAPVAVAVGMPPHRSSNNPFGFEDDETPVAASPKRRKKGRGLLLLAVMFFFLFLLGVAGAAGVGYKIYLDSQKSDPSFADNGGNTSIPARDRDAKSKNTTSGPDKKASKVDGVQKSSNPTNDPFPRRALLISVNNYLMFNTVHYGSYPDPERRPEPYAGSSTAVLRDRLTRSKKFPATQVFELSDGIPEAEKKKGPPLMAGMTDETPKAHSTQKSVLQTTITDFLTTSRTQDRIVIFFAGHGALLEDKAYLVPIDGNLKKPDTLLPLQWVYDQMAKCKAQQKVLIVDVFRFSPSRGFELPSPGEGDEGKMPEGFEKAVLSPPDGVQVWCACSKDQSSVELDEGSAFMQAMSNSLQGGAKQMGIANQSDPLPVEEWAAETNARLKTLLAGEKRTQVSRLAGKVSTSVVPFDASELLATAIKLKPPTAAGGDAAGAAQIERILEELRVMPAVRDTRAGDINLLKAHNLPAFPAKIVDAYKPDGYQNITDLQSRYKKNADAFAKEFPLRAAYFDALEALQDTKNLRMREILSKSDADPKRKAAFLLEQAPLALSIFNLEQSLAAFKAAAEMRDMETSKRWQANFDYMNARLLSRLMYLYEYNYTLGQIRADNLPELANTQSGWRIGVSGAKINVTEPKAKAYQKDVGRLWKRITEEYPDTPWELLAQRESMIALGLVWRPKSD